MSGRLENDLKIKKLIEKNLEPYPQVVKDYYESILASKQMRTCEEYMRIIRHYYCFIDPNVASIDITTCPLSTPARFLTSITTKVAPNGERVETSASHRKTVWHALNSFYSYLYKRRMINENPMSVIDKPNYSDVIKRDVPNLEELQQIIASFDEDFSDNYNSFDDNDQWKSRDRLLFLLLTNTGMRISACLQIDVDDLDVSQRSLKVIDKRHKEHEYYLNDTVMEAMKDWLEERASLLPYGSTEKALFLSIHGTRLSKSTATYIIRETTEAVIGRKLSPHKFRAAYCTLLYQKTGDIEFVRQAVGHNSINTTQKYIQCDNTAKKKASELLQELGI